MKKERWLKTKLDLLDTFCAFLPLWSILLAEAIGLLIVAYLCWKWIKKFRRRSQLYTPTVTIPTFLSQDDDF